MQAMKHLFILLLLFLPMVLPAQLLLDGQWTGTITKDLYPGAEVFEFTLILKRNDSGIEGQSIVKSGHLFATMEITGAISGDVVYFKETNIVDSQQPESMEWCLKNAHLFLTFKEGVPYLEGMWEGYTSFKTCSPGKISLHRPVLRP
jgi:hypothetical protein